MRIITLNCNGIRSAARKGVFGWLEKQNADVICVQETKAQMHLLRDHDHLYLDGYHHYFHDAEKKGYSGVGIYCRQEPKKISIGLGWDVADREGRYVQVDFNNISVASLYLPSGTSGEERQTIKYRFMDQYLTKLKDISSSHRDFIICGDWNIAHKKIDLKHWQANQNSSGFLPEERAWMDKVFGEVGLIDAFRVVNQQSDQYTWWSNFGRAWENNAGWRIDYQVITQSLRDKVISANIYKDERFSDHSPLTIDYNYIF